MFLHLGNTKLAHVESPAETSSNVAMSHQGTRSKIFFRKHKLSQSRHFIRSTLMTWTSLNALLRTVHVLNFFPEVFNSKQRTDSHLQYLQSAIQETEENSEGPKKKKKNPPLKSGLYKRPFISDIVQFWTKWRSIHVHIRQTIPRRRFFFIAAIISRAAVSFRTSNLRSIPAGRHRGWAVSSVNRRVWLQHHAVEPWSQQSWQQQILSHCIFPLTCFFCDQDLCTNMFRVPCCSNAFLVTRFLSVSHTFNCRKLWKIVSIIALPLFYFQAICDEKLWKPSTFKFSLVKINLS